MASNVQRLSLLGAVERRLHNHGRDAVGHGMDLVADAEPAKDLQGAEAQVAGFRIDEDLLPPFHQK